MIKAEDHDLNQIYVRYIDPEYNVEIGIHPVIYGWRVRAGYIGDDWCHLDYCCGSDPIMLKFILSVCKTILETNGCDFKVFPRQHVKPITSDAHCFSELISLMDASKFEMVDLPPLGPLKAKSIEEIFKNADNV